MANKPLQSIKFPGLPDKYTVPQIDSNFDGVSGKVPDSKKVHDEIDSLKEDLNVVADALELQIPIKETFSATYDPTNIVEEITLKKGVTYTLKANTSVSVNGLYVWLRDSDGNNLIALAFANESVKTGTYTPPETMQGCYIRSRVSTASLIGTQVTTALENDEQNAIEIINSRIDNIPNADAIISEVTGYTKPNLISGKFRDYSYNGVTYTVNEDNTVRAVGTASGTSYTNAEITLPAGTYLLNGCEGGNTQTYHIAIVLDGAFVYQYDGTDKEFTLAEETNLMIYCRIVSGTTVDAIFKPMIRLASVYNPTYVPYGEYQIYKPIQQLIDYTAFNWSGKKMNVIGDSIVKGDYGNFINVIRDILCLSEARNYGVGGSCLASSSADADYPPAVLRYENMDLDAQIIIVHAGTNDYSAQIPLGADDSTDITTFNGALNVMMNGLRDMYPTALIIFDSILHRFNDGALTIKASQYRQCIENRCLANHIVFYDCYKYSGFDFTKGYYDHILTGDGLHPNQIGANILGRKLAGFIRWN